jgi:hypothetical protein
VRAALDAMGEPGDCLARTCAHKDEEVCWEVLPKATADIRAALPVIEAAIDCLGGKHVPGADLGDIEGIGRVTSDIHCKHCGAHISGWAKQTVPLSEIKTEAALRAEVERIKRPDPRGTGEAMTYRRRSTYDAYQLTEDALAHHAAWPEWVRERIDAHHLDGCCFRPHAKSPSLYRVKPGSWLVLETGQQEARLMYAEEFDALYEEIR